MPAILPLLEFVPYLSSMVRMEKQKCGAEELMANASPGQAEPWNERDSSGGPLILRSAFALLQQDIYAMRL